MNDRSEAADGMAVDVSRIDRELSELWRAAAEASQAGELTPITRACLVNLVSWAAPGAPALRLKILGDRLSLTVPARILHVRPEREHGSAGVDAWISANCHLAPEGGKEICSEEVTLAGRAGGVDELPSLVLSLLTPDVPTAVFVASGIARERRRGTHSGEGAEIDPALARIVAACDRLIVDSGYDCDARGVTGLRSLARALPSNGSAGDLAWRRMAPWRMAVSDEFDRALAGRAGDVERAEIDVSRGGAPEPGAPVVATTARGSGAAGLSEGLLLAGWIASRLEWRVAAASVDAPFDAPSPQSERDGAAGRAARAHATFSARFETRSGPAEVLIRAHARAAEGAARIAGLRLDLRGGSGRPARALRITALPDDTDVVMGIDTEGDTARIARMIRHPDEQLLARELRFIGGDPMFRAAFDAASSIAAAAGV